MIVDDLFAGYAVLESTFVGMLLTKNASGTPTDADALPTYRVYSAQGNLTSANGTCALLDAANTDGAYSYTIPCTSANGFAAGQNISILFSYVVGGVTKGAVHVIQIA